MYSSHSILFVKVTTTLIATPNMDKIQCGYNGKLWPQWAVTTNEPNMTACMSQVYNFLGSFNSQRLKAISRCCLTLYTYICWTVRALRGASGEPSAKLPSDSRGVPLAWLRGTTSMRLRGGSAEQTTTVTSSKLVYKFRWFVVSASQLHYNDDLCATAIIHVNLAQPVSLCFLPTLVPKQHLCN